MNALTPDETILGLLAAQEAHGYQLLEHFRDPAGLGRVWHLGTSQLYAVLKRLERLEWIVGSVFESENAPPRIEYTLTFSGREHLTAWLDTSDPSPSIRRVRVEFLSRLYVAHRLHLPTDALVQRQMEACQRERERLIARLTGEDTGFGTLSTQLVIGQLEAIVAWMDRCELIPSLNYPLQECKHAVETPLD